MKILHSADWHLDAPMKGIAPEMKKIMQKNLRSIPEKIAELSRKEHCDLMLLAGDLFDGPYTRESCEEVYRALEEVQIPVLISPGNHDYIQENSPWNREIWPENVYIFTKPEMTSVVVPELDCRVYGAGYTGMDCMPLLEDFCAEGPEKWKIGILHGDPVNSLSPYSPVSRLQVQRSGLHYLALGHIHRQGSFRAGDTLCAWPGCPMGRGFDETGVKGVLITELSEKSVCRFESLGFPEFHSLQTECGNHPEDALNKILPPVGNDFFYRVTLTGEQENLDLEALKRRFDRFPNLQLIDRTFQPVNIWQNAGEDSFEGLYFSLLREKTEDPDSKKAAELAAKISRLILEGQEVTLP